MNTDILTRIRVEVLRESIGDGPVWKVRACQPPTSAVMVGRERLQLHVSDPNYGRIDLVAIQTEPLDLVVLMGVPSNSPLPPVVPTAVLLLPLAYINRHACSTAVLDCHIVPIPEETRPEPAQRGGTRRIEPPRTPKR